MDNTISHHNGDFLQRHLYPFPPRNIQPILNTPSPEMAAHPSRNANGVSHGNTRMRRLRARPFTGDNVCFGARGVVRYTGE